MPELIKELQEANFIDVSDNVRGGVPVLKGTRFPIARIFAQLGELETIEDIANDLDLDLDLISRMFDAIALYLDKSFTRKA